MTMLTAILTFRPLGLAAGQGQWMRQPLAVAIIAGLVPQFPPVLPAMAAFTVKAG